MLGLDKAISRFLPIYDEHGEHGKLFGTLLMASGTVLRSAWRSWCSPSGSTALPAATWAARPALAVILILICLSPIQALDDVLMGVFAVFSKPRAIFFRNYVLAPGLRLAAIVFIVSPVRGAAAGDRLRARRRPRVALYA